MRWSRFILYISCSSLRISHFSKRPFLWTITLETKIGALDMLIASGVSLLLSLQWNVSMLTYVYTHSCNYFSLYTSVSTQAKDEFTLMSLNLIQCHIVHSSLSFLFVTSSSNCEKSVSHHVPTTYLFIQS